MTGFIKHTLLATALFLTVPSAWAGAYFGGESDDSDQSLIFVGAESEGPLFGAIFVGRLRYTYEDGGQDIDVTSDQISPKVGYRWTSRPITVSLAVGATLEYKQENGAQYDNSDSIGGVAQMGAFYWAQDHSAELLLSYST
jgi:hypothetical protein